ncbi:hypothetical protein GCM10027403_10000 [Arthrobacter tecti]
MEKALAPIFDDDGTEISRDVYWGQKELGTALGTTPVYVGRLLRLVGLLRHEPKEPTAEALESGAAIYVTVDTADGPHRYPRWKKEVVLKVLSQALEEHPKPASGANQARGSGLAQDLSQTMESRVNELERRVESLERQLMRASLAMLGASHSP